ncbi:269_t:CDS:2 [Ambispora leptoticha]|uniref:269_t:CDS:1 n=1 Tax=Ambispora leptoticha TaxID=144679 RepID=A0A9N8WL47_9GLOM|nr:269_t:CDS:2 [Ambispora leptoticha]
MHDTQILKVLLLLFLFITLVNESSASPVLMRKRQAGPQGIWGPVTGGCKKKRCVGALLVDTVNSVAGNPQATVSVS